MTAVHAFIKSEWKENERAIAKQKSLRDLREALDRALKEVADANARSRTPHRKPSSMDGFYRFVICAVVWIPWFWIIAIPSAFALAILLGIHGDLGPFFVLAVAGGATAAAWNTPEIVFWLKERLRVHSVRKEACEDLERLSNLAAELRQEIAAVEETN